MKSRIVLIVMLLSFAAAPSGAIEGGAAQPKGGETTSFKNYFRDPTRVIEMRKRKITTAQRKEAAARQAAARAKVQARQAREGGAK